MQTRNQAKEEQAGRRWAPVPASLVADNQISQGHFNTVFEKIRELLGFDSAMCARITQVPETDGISPAEELRQMLAKIARGKNFKLKRDTEKE